MISSQLHRAKQSTLPPGHPPATAPLTRSCLPTPTAAVLFASFQLLSPGFALPSPQYRPPNASRPRSTPQSTCLIPHSRSCTVGCHTSRDFVPWRFSDASCRRAWIAFSSRRPRNLNMNRPERVQQGLSTESLLLNDLVGAHQRREQAATAGS